MQRKKERVRATPISCSVTLGIRSCLDATAIGAAVELRLFSFSDATAELTIFTFGRDDTTRFDRIVEVRSTPY